MGVKPATVQCRVILRGFLIAAMGGVAASCSSDAMRFTDRMYTAAIPQASQQGQVVGVVSQPIVQTAAQQAFPAQLPTVTPPNIDYTTTASVQRRAITNRVISAVKPVPLGLVGATNRLASAPVLLGAVQPQIVQPQVTYQAPTIQRPQIVAPTLPTVQPVSIPQVQQVALPTPTIQPVAVPVPQPAQKTVLSQLFPPAPKVEAVPVPQIQPIAVTAPSVTPPSGNGLLPSTVDMQTTGSINPATAQTTPITMARPQPGWSTANASRVTLKSGETVYNLSRRFGVPADVIYSVNGLENNAPVQAGQTLIIPVYQYGAAAPISAPDANPDTKLAKSTAGTVLDLPDSDAPQPAPRPFYQMAVLPQTPQLRERKPVQTPNVVAAPVASATPIPQPVPNVVPTSAPQLSGSSYRVVSGDSLYGIARRHNVTVANLKAANQLGDGYLKVGQTLRIPAGGATSSPSIITQPAITPSTNQTASIANVDPIVTGNTSTSATSVQKVEQQTAAVPAPAQSGVSRLRMPVQGRIVTDFKARENGRLNDGIDIAVPTGTSVRAAENGVVIYSGEGLSEYGRTVLIRHDDGLVTVYGHADQLKVTRGQTVKRGQEIALSGMTGQATRPKLHFEVRKNTVPVNPNIYLN